VETCQWGGQEPAAWRYREEFPRCSDRTTRGVLDLLA